MKRLVLLAALATFVAVAGCSKKDPAQEPAELPKFESSARVKTVWTAGIGGGEPKLRLGLNPALEGESVFAAGHDGEVAAFSMANGKRLWRVNTKLPLTAGPGAGSGVVIVGASHGDIVALDAATGEQRWKSYINSELLSAPAIEGDYAVMRAVDGRFFAMRVADGTIAWTAEQQVPRLSLRGTSRPQLVGGLAVAGFDNGRLMAINVADGTTAWEVAVSPPAGRTELERLVDIDSTVHISGEDVFAVTYQGRIARLARESGQVWWSRELSSNRGLATDEDGVYVSTADGVVIKIGRRTGVELWRQDGLSRRRLSAPVVLGGYVAVADLDGYVHFLDVNTGDIAARDRVGGERVRSDPLVKDGVAVFMDEGGKLAAMSIESKNPAPKTEEASP